MKEEEVQKDKPTSATDARDISIPNIGRVPSHYSKNSSHKTEKEHIKKRQQKTASFVELVGHSLL